MRIYSRRDWGARYRAGFGSREVFNLRTYLHHSAGASAGVNATLAQDYKNIRAVEATGQGKFGGGISYTFVLSEAGRVFEGTGVSRLGAHTGGHNSHGVGICFMGNFELRPVNSKMINAAAELLVHGVKRGWWVKPRFTAVHTKVPGAATACPGKNLIAAVSKIHARADELMGGPVVVNGKLDMATIGEWQRQRGTAVDGLISVPESRLAISVQRLLNAKNGHGQFKLGRPLEVTGRFDGRTWMATIKLLNAWHAQGKLPLSGGPLVVKSKPSARDNKALQKSLQLGLWKGRED